jgi:RNA polymerase subunit RPABC4/transcription elongation factor Spt4
MITSCRECQHQISDQAIACPNCGAPFPARPGWDGIGLISVSQFTVAGLAVAQFAAAYSLIAQFGLYVSEGHGQLVFSLPRLLGLL